jgi:hypothetical protein
MGADEIPYSGERGSQNLLTNLRLSALRLNSSVGLVTGYGLDDLDSVLGRAKFVSSPQLPYRLWDHPACYPIGIRGGGV